MAILKNQIPILKFDILRAESDIYNLILDIAKNDVRIKAVYMNGSRTNNNVPKDIFKIMI